MPREGFRSITINEKSYVRLMAYCKKHKTSPYKMLQQRLKEREELIMFAMQITKVPQTIRILTTDARTRK